MIPAKPRLTEARRAELERDAARMAEYEAWIQRAKALLFDLRFACDSRSLRAEALQLLVEGGGYDERISE